MLKFAIIEFLMILGMLLFIAYINYGKSGVNVDGTINMFYYILYITSCLMILIALFFTTILPNIRHYLIVKNGIKTKGKILAIEPLWYLNNRPKAKFTLEVLKADESSFITSVKGMMYSKKRLLKFEIGDWLNVFYDAQDFSKIAIVHPEITPPQLHLLSTKTKRQS